LTEFGLSFKPRRGRIAPGFVADEILANHRLFFAANALLSRLGEAQEREWQPLDFNPKKNFKLFSARDRMLSFLHIGAVP
jgi:hypothetical protein